MAWNQWNELKALAAEQLAAYLRQREVSKAHGTAPAAANIASPSVTARKGHGTAEQFNAQQQESEWDESKQENRATWSSEPSAATSLKSGTIKSYFHEKGFGFIVPDEGEEDIYAGWRRFNGNNFFSCQAGVRVKFHAVRNEKHGKMQASVWQLDTDGAIATPTQALAVREKEPEAYSVASQVYQAPRGSVELQAISSAVKQEARRVPLPVANHAEWPDQETQRSPDLMLPPPAPRRVPALENGVEWHGWRTQALGGKQSRFRPGFVKKRKMCWYVETQGYCKNGDSCNFAHTADELEDSVTKPRLEDDAGSVADASAATWDYNDYKESNVYVQPEVEESRLSGPRPPKAPPPEHLFQKRALGEGDRVDFKRGDEEQGAEESNAQKQMLPAWATEPDAGPAVAVPGIAAAPAWSGPVPVPARKAASHVEAPWIPPMVTSKAAGIPPQAPATTPKAPPQVPMILPPPEESAAFTEQPVSALFSVLFPDEESDGGSSVDVLEDDVQNLDEAAADRFQEAFSNGRVLGDDLQDWCLKQYRDFMDDKADAVDGPETTQEVPELHSKFPKPNDFEVADTVMEHFFWCMGGLLGNQRGLEPPPPPKLPTLPLEAPQTTPKAAPPKAPPLPRKRQAPSPQSTRSSSPKALLRSPRSPQSPRSLSPRSRSLQSRSPLGPKKRKKRRRRRHRTSRSPSRSPSRAPGSPMRSFSRSASPVREPARIKVLRRIMGDEKRLEQALDIFPESEFPWTEEAVPMQHIEIFREEPDCWAKPVVIRFGPTHCSLVLGSSKEREVSNGVECLVCIVYYWQDAPAPLACKMCLMAMKCGEKVENMLRRFLEGKRHAIFDPAENPKAWDLDEVHQADISVQHIRHSHDAVHATFQHGQHRGKHVQDLVDKLLSGETLVEDLTPFVVIELGHQEFWAVFGNRRLKALKLFQQQAGPRFNVRARCLCWAKDEVPASLACKLAMSATTTNDGKWADWQLPKGKGKGKGGKGRH